jgi:hypothetical protein
MLEQTNRRNKVVYAVYGIIDHTLANKGISLQFWLNTIRFYAAMGF